MKKISISIPDSKNNSGFEWLTTNSLTTGSRADFNTNGRSTKSYRNKPVDSFIQPSFTTSVNAVFSQTYFSVIVQVGRRS